MICTRRTKMRAALVAIAFIFETGCVSHPCSSYVIADVVIADPTAGASPGPQNIVVESGSIVSIGQSKGQGKINGRCRHSYAGAYAIPGLWDMHMHVAKVGAESMPLFIANGVTSVRDMGGDLDIIRRVEAAIESGDIVGPRILTAGPMLDTRAAVDRAVADGSRDDHAKTRIIVDGPEDAASAVAHLKAMGADFVKVRDTQNAQTYEAILAAGRDAHMQIAGHPRWDYKPAEAARRGHASFEHGFYPFPLSDLSAEDRADLFLALRESGAAHVPTLIAWRGFTLPPSELERALLDKSGGIDPRNALLSPELRENWNEYLTEWRESTRDPQAWTDAVALAAADIGEFHRAGVSVFVGTDAAVPFVHPGSGVADEMMALHEIAGLSPAAALIAATSGPAAFVGKRAIGTLAPGNAADIVLLDADPRTDLSAIRKIVAVISRGRFYDRAALDALKADAQREFGAPKSP